MTPKELCLRVNEEIFARGDVALTEELIAPDFVDHAAPPGTPPGPASIKRTVEMIHAGLSDIRYEITDAIAEGDRVAIRLTMHGTHTGNLFGNEPTGRTFAVEHMHMFRVEDGRVAEHWARRDDAGMMRQLGIAR